MKRNHFLLLALVLLGGYRASAGIYYVTGDKGDYALAFDNSAISPTTTTLRIGANTGTPSGGRNTVLIFAMPTLPTNEVVVSARLTVQIQGLAGTTAYNVDLYSLGFKPNTNAVTGYYAGASDPSNAKLYDNFIASSTGGSGVISTTNGTVLGNLIYGFYAAQTNYAGGQYLFLRLSPDAVPAVNPSGWSIYSADSTLGQPVLQITTSKAYRPTSHVNDYVVNEDNTLATLGINSLRTGGNNTAPVGGRNAVVLFELPVLQTNEILTSARLDFSVLSRAGTPTFNIDLWSLGISNSAAQFFKYFEGDSGDPNAVKIEDNVITPSITAATNLSTSITNGLTGYLQNFYTNNPGYAGGKYLFLRFTPDADAGGTSIGWDLGSVEGGKPARMNLAIKKRASGPNFIVIITDDQRYDAMGVVLREQGAAARFPWFANETPNLDRLATNGIRFRNGFVTLSLCSPSRATILTGRYNHFNGVIGNDIEFPASNRTFATQLGDVGYMTGWMGKFHHGKQFIRPGFEEVASYIEHGQYNNCPFVVNGNTTATTGWVDDVTASYATNFINTYKDQAFALVVGFKTPHDVPVPPPRSATLYSNQVPGNVPNLGVNGVLAPWLGAPVADNFEKVRDYFRCVKGMDDSVGVILDQLDTLGLTTNTMVIFCGDNGFFWREHGLSDKRAAYEEGMRIPLLVRYPTMIPTPAVRDEMVLNLDFAPTMLDMAGVPIPPSMQGTSWRPIFENNVSNWRQSFFYEYFLETGINVWTELSVRTMTNKLIKYPGNENFNEVFDLTSDPYEVTNLVNHPLYAAARGTLESEFNRLLGETGLGARISAPTLTATNAQFQITSGFGPRYQFEYSSDFQTWTNLQEVKMIGTVTNVTDTNAPNGQRFYRAKMMAN
jgi:arylsulfatase A-like enzyme